MLEVFVFGVFWGLFGLVVIVLFINISVMFILCIKGVLDIILFLNEIKIKFKKLYLIFIKNIVIFILYGEFKECVKY